MAAYEAGIFIPPVFYNFKPFFTLQPVLETREKQLKLWRELIVSYQVHHKISVIPDPYTFALFKNEELGRELPREGIKVVVDSLISEGLAQWEDESNNTANLIIMTESPTLIANQIYEWANKYAITETIITFYDLHSGDGYTSSEFEGVDKNILRKALEILVEADRAIIFRGDTPDEDGIKFIREFKEKK